MATARRRWLLLAFPALGALALTLALVSHALAAARTVHIDEHVTISVPVFDTCTGQTVTLSGDAHFQAEDVIDDGAGVVGQNVHIHENFQIVGTDDQGTKYILHEEDQLVLNGRVYADGSGREEVSQPVTLVLVSQGATPNLILHATDHFTINANGTITAEVLNLIVTCQG